MLSFITFKSLYPINIPNTDKGKSASEWIKELESLKLNWKKGHLKPKSQPKKKEHQEQKVSVKIKKAV